MSRILPLSPKLAHQRWQRFTDYRHAEKLTTVPVVAPESAQAAADMPLVFVKQGEQFVLSALLGLARETNHCLNEQHGWEAGYVPAWLRTPPFRIIVPPGGKPSQRALGIDQQSPWLDAAGDQGFEETLLDDQQQLTPAVKEVFEFLTKLEKHVVKTQQAVDALASHKLLTPWKLDPVAGTAVPHLYRIDENAFHALPDDVFNTLRRKGAVAIAYTQMISTHQLPALKQRAQKTTVPKNIDLDALFGEGGDGLSFDFDRS
ncbi:hypothetical protein M911_05035 [Ectothiorhodospira haloalkaliphila]|uniref:SapC family protein n=1 Tax=Ectothiorhodospira haloalkaliphila TaxID=421628 RepID=W8KLJ2_9GAMM|nr:SapC family protein [Ectothiorhodospira haloalkaliphila]AHK80624.1 hypothetical protein M911_05035 [Ectothiorhodospira haloalkaliphila]